MYCQLKINFGQFRRSISHFLSFPTTSVRQLDYHDIMSDSVQTEVMELVYELYSYCPIHVCHETDIQKLKIKKNKNFYSIQLGLNNQQ